MSDPKLVQACPKCGDARCAVQDSEFCLGRQVDSLREENERLRELVGDAVKYIVEDKAITPRATRLERWVDRARAGLRVYLRARPTKGGE
jgi:hypothetical protein